MVSKVCHSQLSSSTLARAAHIPPWAAPVWERVGYSLVITAVRPRRELSSAARRPAPPAPTITTSKVCCWVMGLLGSALRVLRPLPPEAISAVGLAACCPRRGAHSIAAQSSDTLSERSRQG